MKRAKKYQNANVHQLELVVKAAIYLRVSTEEQAQQGYGLDVQRERCKAQAVAKGWEIVGEYADEGISGTKDASQRPALAEMLSAAGRGEINAVIVLALDRLGRKTSLVLNLVEELAISNVALVSCKESLDTSTPQGQFVLTMFAALAQLERDTIVERTTAGRNERGKRDGEKGGRVPYGYKRLSDGAIVIDQSAAIVVRKIFDLRLREHTLQAIADYLNDAGIPTARSENYPDSQWYASSVKCVLDNHKAYLGGNRGESQIVWEAILK